MSTSEKWSSVMGSSKRGKTKITTTNENESEVTTSVSITGTTPTPGDDLGPMMSMMLFEEADVLLEEDKGFTAALIHLAASKKRPIILMSNVSNPSLPAALLRHHVEFQTPRTRELFLQTAMVAAAEALQPPPSLMEHMIYSCSHDLRRLLLVFQFWGQMAQGPLQLRDTCGAGAEEALIQDVGPLVEEKQEKTCDSKPFAASEEANITQFNNELLAAAFESAEPMSTNEDGCQIKDWPLSRSRQGGGYSKARGLGTTTSIDGWPVDVGEVPYHEIQHRALSHFFDVACSCPLPVIVNEKITKTVQEEQQAAEMASAQLAMQTMLAERKRLEAAALLRKQERKAKAAARRAQLEGQTKTTAKLTNEQEGQKEGGRPAVPRENQLMEKSGTGLNCGSKDESLSRPEHEQRQGKRETRMLCALTESENLEKVGDGKPPSNLEGYVKERTKQKLLSGYLVGWICNSAMENETSTGTCPGLGAPMLPLFEVNRDDAVQAGPGSGRSIGSSTATEISGDEKLGISKRIARIGNMKRRRSKLKRQKKGVQMSPKAVDDDKACEICKKPEPEETMLLCDSCNAGWHMECLDPKILELPSGKWFCPLCMLHNAQHQGPEPVHMSKQTGRVDGIDRQASDGHLVNTRLPAPSEVKEQRLRNLVDTGLYRGSSVDEGVGMVKSEPDVGLCEISHQTAGVTVEDTRSDNGAICLQINDVSKRDGEKERFDRDTEDDDFERRNGIVLLESKVGEIAAGKAVGKLPSMRLRCLNEEAGCRAEDTARGRAEGVEGISSFLLNDSKDLGMSDVEKWCRAETSDVRGEQLESVINGMSKAECPVKGTGEVILCAAKCLQDGERPGEESNEGRKAMTDDFVQHLLKKAEYQLSSFNSLSQQIPAARDELYSSFVLTSKPMVDVENDKALSSCDLEEEPMQREDKGELAHDKGWIDGSGSFQQIGLPCILGEQQTVVASTEYGITTEHGVGNKVQQQRAETLNDSFHAGDVAPCCHQARPTEEVESVVNLSPKPDSLSVDAQLTNGNEQPREMSTEGAVLADATEDIREANPVTVERVWKSMLGERDAWQHLIEATFRQNEGILETVAGIVQSISDADVLSSLECFATMADLPFQQPCSTWSGRSLPDSWNRRASAEAAEAAVLLVEAASACCRPTPLPNKKLRKGPESPCGREIPQQAADGREPSPLLEDDAEGALPEAELAVTGAALFDMEKTWGKRCRLLERSVGEIVPPARRLCAARGACHEYAAYVGCMLQGAQEGTCDAGSRRGSSHAVVARSLRVNNDTVRCIQKCSTFGR